MHILVVSGKRRERRSFELCEQSCANIIAFKRKQPRMQSVQVSKIALSTNIHSKDAYQNRDYFLSVHSMHFKNIFFENAWIIYSRKCSEFMSCWCVEYLFHTLLSYKTVTLCVWANPTQRKQTTFISFYSLTFRPNVGLLFFPKLNFTCKKALLWSVRHKWFAPGLLMLVSYFLMSLRTLRRKAKHSTCRNF